MADPRQNPDTKVAGVQREADPLFFGAPREDYFTPAELDALLKNKSYQEFIKLAESLVRGIDSLELTPLGKVFLSASKCWWDWVVLRDAHEGSIAINPADIPNHGEVFLIKDLLKMKHDGNLVFYHPGALDKVKTFSDSTYKDCFLVVFSDEELKTCPLRWVPAERLQKSKFLAAVQNLKDTVATFQQALPPEKDVDGRNQKKLDLLKACEADGSLAEFNAFRPDLVLAKAASQDIERK